MDDAERSYYMNISPNPSSLSGVLRLVAEANAETVLRLDPHIGFSHRGLEKLLELRTPMQGISLLDHLHLGFGLSFEHSFVLACEKLAGIDAPLRAKYIRVLFAELTRILSYMTSVKALANDVGMPMVGSYVDDAVALISLFFIMTFGQSVASAYFRVGGVKTDIPQNLSEALFLFATKQLPEILEKIEDLLTENPVFKQRTQGIGAISAERAVSYGFSGINLRACGVEYDLRVCDPYDAYAFLGPEIITVKEGDCYARYALMLDEIRQSLKLIRRVVSSIKEGPVNVFESLLEEPSLPSDILRFRTYAEGLILTEGEVYVATESPFGEFGIYFVSDGSGIPYRCHIRSAGFAHLQALDELCRGHSIKDIRVILSSLNIVMNEVDR